MEQSIIDFLVNQIGQNGVFFALFIYLFYTGKKESKDREERLINELNNSHELSKTLAEKYDIIVSDIREIKDELKKGDGEK
jgi:site-specific recombinase